MGVDLYKRLLLVILIEHLKRQVLNLDRILVSDVVLWEGRHLILLVLASNVKVDLLCRFLSEGELHGQLGPVADMLFVGFEFLISLPFVPFLDVVLFFLFADAEHWEVRADAKIFVDAAIILFFD